MRPDDGAKRNDERVRRIDFIDLDIARLAAASAFPGSRNHAALLEVMVETLDGGPRPFGVETVIGSNYVVVNVSEDGSMFPETGGHLLSVLLQDPQSSIEIRREVFAEFDPSTTGERYRFFRPAEAMGKMADDFRAMLSHASDAVAARMDRALELSVRRQALTSAIADVAARDDGGSAVLGKLIERIVDSDPSLLDGVRSMLAELAAEPEPAPAMRF